MAAVAFWRVVQLFWIFQPYAQRKLASLSKPLFNKKAQPD
jgi:hypothetical protein